MSKVRGYSKSTYKILMNTEESAKTIAKIIFAAALRDGEGFISESHLFISGLREILGDKGLKEYFAHNTPFLLVLTECAVDYALCKTLSQKSVDDLKKLPVEGRVGVELLLLQITGRSIIRKNYSQWAKPLWSIKTTGKKLIENSLSGLTSEELSEFIKPLAVAFVSEMIEELKEPSQTE